MIAGTVCGVPEVRRRCRSARTTSGTAIPEETNAPYGVAKKSILVGAQALPRAVRDQRDLPAADEPLRAARQLRPRDVARDPGADPEDARVARRDRPLGRRVAEPRVPLRRGLRRRRSCSPPSATTAPEPVNLGTGVETTIRETRGAGRRADGLHRRDPLGRVDAERPAAAEPRRLAREGAVRLRGADVAPRRASSGRSPGTGLRRPSMPLRERARPLWSLIVRHQPWSVLGPLIAIQWLALLVFALSGRAQRLALLPGRRPDLLLDDAHLLSHWTLPVALVGYAWSYLLIPVALVAGANVLSGLPGGDPAQHADPAAGRAALRVRDRRRGSPGGSSATGRRRSGC